MVDQVTVDDTAVRQVSPEGGVKEVRWDDLAEVGIVTTDAGPFDEDVYWMLIDAGGEGIAVPSSAVTDELLDRLQTLPGFDNEQMIHAMSSTEDARFVCWQRDGG